MEKELIKAIIMERQRSVMDMNLTHRKMEFEDSVNYVLTGIRRSGKSCMMLQDMRQRIADEGTREGHCLYFNFEDERLVGMKADDLGLLLECHAEMFGSGKPYVYLDEIQLVEGWEKFVRRLADEKYRVMVTGSNATMLSSEMATTLGGRFVIRHVYPFSFQEYLDYCMIKRGKNWLYEPDTRVEVLRKFETYFHFGGFAESFPMVNKREWLNSLYQKILLGDIVSRNMIRNDRVLRLLAKKVADSVMQPSALSRLRNVVKSTGDGISLPTLKDYLQYMESAYLIFAIPNYCSPVTERETMKKRYFYDNGLLNNFLLDGGAKLLENICAVHLMKRYSNADEWRLFYYHHRVEVDFYVPDEDMAVQVAYSIADDETRRREVGALLQLHAAHPLRKALIVTRDEEEKLEVEGLEIAVIPVWKWLSATK